MLPLIVIMQLVLRRTKEMLHTGSYKTSLKTVGVAQALSKEYGY